MLAIACKKGGESTDPGTFSVSQAGGNVLTAIVQTNGTTFNSEVKILFSSDKPFSFALTSATTNGVNAMEGLSYDTGTGKITFPDEVITNGTLTNGKGTNITYSLVFTVNADDTSLRNPSQTFNIDAVLKGTTLVTKENIKALFTSTTQIKSTGSGVDANKDRHKFLMKDDSNNIFEDAKATFNDGEGGKYPMEISVITAAVQSEINANFGTYFSQATIGTPSVSDTDKSLLTVPLNLTTKPEYEFEATYNLEFVLYKSKTEKATGTENEDIWIN